MNRKHVVLIGILLLFSTLAFSITQYMPNIGEIIGDKEVRINQTFDNSQKYLKLEIYLFNNSGSVKIIVINPNNKIIDAVEIANNKIEKITKEYPNIEGSWRVIISPKGASGKYIIKLHNEAKYIGLTKDDEKVLNNVYVWPIQ
jgi:hypothetical protein